MVNTKQINDLLHSHFIVTGTLRIDPTSGVVDVRGSVLFDGKTSMSTFPVTFGHVSGKFQCDTAGLTSLKGAPSTVGGSFWVNNNLLTSLEGAPQEVGSHFWCYSNLLKNLKGGPTSVGKQYDCDSNPLESLEGIPHSLNGPFVCEYQKNLPLLRMLNAQKIELLMAPTAVQTILDKYAGQGQKGALACAAELADAGFKENARW